MNTPLEKKSSLSDIQHRFDQDVERFAELKTGQASTMDALLSMELITQAAVASTSPIQHILDIGCGAGNNTIRLRQVLGTNLDVTLLDLSQPMLDRATQRIAPINTGKIYTVLGDFRTADLKAGKFDIILAAAVLHHLRDKNDWQTAFKKIYNLLRPGGSVWITDLVSHETLSIQNMMWTRYGDYLSSLKGTHYRDEVFSYIDKEDSPRPVTFQLDLLQKVGFAHVELLHKNTCFAAFGAIK